MAKIITVREHLDVPELQVYRTLRRPHDHFEQRIFVGEGENVVRRLLDSPLHVRSLLLTPQWCERLSGIPRLDDEHLILYLAPQELLETIVGFPLHQGLMAVGEMPPEPVLDETLSRMNAPGLIVALDGLVNAENVGVIVRNCAAFGVDLIVAGETSSSPYLRRSVRNSMGAIFTLPVIHATDLSGMLDRLHGEFGYAILATYPAGEQTLYCSELRGNVCLVVGNEGNGISQAVLEHCTGRVSIPMANGTDSLNVANATAVFLSEVVRQRRYCGEHR